MTEFQPLETHQHPTLDITLLEYQTLVSYDGFQVGLEEFEDEVQV